tara:strand:- start:868 stop:1134 length:267 start_codon:yes stop_codon:yes gene_type:complete
MNSLSDLIIPFFMALIMMLSGYMVALVGDWIKKVIIVPVTCMLLFDGLIVYMFYAIGTTKLQMMMGIMLGTILKIIIFILYQKYLSDE